MPTKKYQVFVSSTFKDLEAERAEVMQALLELDCIPAGMELFPAADETQWSLIQDVIRESDYYVVIVGGRYGSVGSSGQSYTEMEYRFALESGIPILGFVHAQPEKIPAEHTESDPAMKKKLEDFRNLVETKHRRTWRTADELGGLVSRSLVQCIKRTPRAGWVRGDSVLSETQISDYQTMRERLREIDDRAERDSPVSDLARRWLSAEFHISSRGHESASGVYGELFFTIAPHLNRPISDQSLEDFLSVELFGHGPHFVDVADYERLIIGLLTTELVEEEHDSAGRHLVLTEAGRRALFEMGLKPPVEE